MYFSPCPMWNIAAGNNDPYEFLDSLPLVPCPEQSFAGRHDPWQPRGVEYEPYDDDKFHSGEYGQRGALLYPVSSDSWVNHGQRNAEGEVDLMFKSWRPYQYAIVNNPFTVEATCTCVWPNGTGVTYSQGKVVGSTDVHPL